MPPGPPHPLFKVYELVAQVSSDLTVPDLAAAMSTCRLFRHQFSPFFWVELVVRLAVHPSSLALTRVRSLVTTPVKRQFLASNRHHLRYVLLDCPLDIVSLLLDVLLDGDMIEDGSTRTATMSRLRTLSIVDFDRNSLGAAGETTADPVGMIETLHLAFNSIINLLGFSTCLVNLTLSNTMSLMTHDNAVHGHRFVQLLTSGGFVNLKKLVLGDQSEWKDGGRRATSNYQEITDLPLELALAVVDGALDHCPGLETLICRFLVKSESVEYENILNAGAAGGERATKIRTLVLPGVRYPEWLPIAWLLDILEHRVPLLESWDIPRVHFDDMDLVLHVLLSNCPQVKKLTMEFGRCFDRDDCFVAEGLFLHLFLRMEIVQPKSDGSPSALSSPETTTATLDTTMEDLDTTMAALATTPSGLEVYITSEELATMDEDQTADFWHTNRDSVVFIHQTQSLCMEYFPSINDGAYILVTGLRLIGHCLRELDLGVASDFIQNHGLGHIFRYIPSLTRFSVVDSIPSTRRQDVRCSPGDCYAGGEWATLLHSDETTMTDWKCKDFLKSLKIVLQYEEAVPAILSSFVRDCTTHDSDIRACLHEHQQKKHQFYDQVNRLQFLEELTLGYDVSLVAHGMVSIQRRARHRATYEDINAMNRSEQKRARELMLDDFTLPMGLSKLTDLARLKKLSLVGDFWSLMGKTEVEFIHAHWTSLKSVKFSIEDEETFYKVVECSHWVWLKQQRPGLRYLASFMSFKD